MRKMIKIFAFILFLVSETTAWNIPSFVKRLTLAGQSSRRSKMVAESEFQPSQAPGMVVSQVNIFNGQPTYQVPLMGLSAPGMIGWSFSLSYSGGIQPILDQPNDRSPAGPVGLGWSLSTPYVAVDHKGTFTSSDDVIFCDLGPYGGGQIVQNNDNEFYLSTNPYIRIYPTIADDQFNSWMFIFPDGNKLYFGENVNSRRIQRYLGGKIGANPASIERTGAFTYRWDASRFTNFSETSSILFNYTQTMEYIKSVGYTRESQLHKIYWSDASGAEAESIVFTYTQRQSSEYNGYSENESRDDQRLYDTHFLSSLVHYIAKQKYRTIAFKYDQFAEHAAEPKRLLTGFVDQMNGGQPYSWKFS